LPAAWVFGYGGLNGVTLIFYLLPKVTTRNCTHSRVDGLRLEENLVNGYFYKLNE